MEHNKKIKTICLTTALGLALPLTYSCSKGKSSEMNSGTQGYRRDPLLEKLIPSLQEGNNNQFKLTLEEIIVHSHNATSSSFPRYFPWRKLFLTCIEDSWNPEIVQIVLDKARQESIYHDVLNLIEGKITPLETVGLLLAYTPHAPISSISEDYQVARRFLKQPNSILTVQESTQLLCIAMKNNIVWTRGIINDFFGEGGMTIIEGGITIEEYMEENPQKDICRLITEFPTEEVIQLLRIADPYNGSGFYGDNEFHERIAEHLWRQVYNRVTQENTTHENPLKFLNEEEKKNLARRALRGVEDVSTAKLRTAKLLLAPSQLLQLAIEEKKIELTTSLLAQISIELTAKQGALILRSDTFKPLWDQVGNKLASKEIIPLVKIAVSGMPPSTHVLKYIGKQIQEQISDKDDRKKIIAILQEGISWRHNEAALCLLNQIGNNLSSEEVKQLLETAQGRNCDDVISSLVALLTSQLAIEEGKNKSALVESK